jgi:cyclic-di-GMP phosphodiesterase TipF (flagellum assembly factor)
VQSLVYIFIALAGLGVAAAAYFGFTFTPIEALMTGLLFVALAVILLERTLRRRAETRLERGIEDLSRLLSTDAQAGAVLGQRINALVDENAGKRLATIEADISILGTVVRQVAEAVADIEESRRREARRDPPPAPPAPTPTTLVHVAGAPEARRLETAAEPVITLEMLKQALDEQRLLFHIQPIVTLPQRKVHAYDMIPRLMLEDGELAEPADFLPRKGGEIVLRRIERLAIDEAITIARRARTNGQPITLCVTMSRATLVDAVTIERVVLQLEANRAIAGSLVLVVAEASWSAMPLSEKAALAAFTGKGVGLSLADARSLRLNFSELGAEGVRSVRFDAGRFLAEPQSFTDFHSSDVTSYAKRFEVDLIATGIHTEQQILTLLEDGVALAQGPHSAGPGPIRPDLLLERPPAQLAPRRAEA